MGWLPSIEDYRNAFVSVGLPVSKNGNHQSTVPAEVPIISVLWQSSF